MIRRMKAAMVILFTMMALLTGCGKKYTVNIADANANIAISVKSGETVEQVLKEAEISLGENDLISMDLADKIVDETSIIITRASHVTIIKKDGDKIELELAGVTVEQALAKAEIVLGENDAVDQPMDKQIDEAIVISIHERNEVHITVDGATIDHATEAMTVDALLAEVNVTLGENDRLSCDLSAPIESGMTIIINRVEIKEEKVTEEIDFQTKSENDSTLSSGKTKVKQEGVKGEKEITYKVILVDGVEESREVVSEAVTKEPVNKIVLKGTKKVVTKQQTSKKPSSSGTSGKKVTKVEYVDDCDGSGHGTKFTWYSDGSYTQKRY